MANEDHLTILKQGVEEWNKWRGENPGEQPDLVYANLLGANLRGANLRSAKLSIAILLGANLSDAKLSGANLSDAKLSDANLLSAILFHANLSYTDLSGATLRGADLSDANLFYANLRGAKLSEADLSGARFGYTSVVDVDLRETKGLAEIWHEAPSTVGTDTLTKSKGKIKIPEAFLRGCGLTDWEIQATKLWNPDLTRDEITDITYDVVNLKALSPIVLHHVFISYSHADTTFVEKLEAGLDKKRIRYWREVHDLKAGRLEKQIEKAIRANPLVLLVLSEQSVESDWVEWEVSKARELEQKEKRDVLCPIALDDAWKTCDWSGSLRRQIEKYNILDFSEPEAFDAQFEKLVGGIVEYYRPG